MADSDGRRMWLEEYIQDDLRMHMSIVNVLHAGQSEFQQVELCTSGPFGKVLLLDGKVQSAEADEFVYHECLVHPALLHHPNPKTVFICGGGEGATAREVLRHKSVEKVVMVDIDKVVCDFCAQHLEANKAAFSDPRLELIYDDAQAQLEKYNGKFDVIIGDLADPVYGGPCYQLYTQEFYKNIVAQRLHPGGIFVTQSGPCGVLSHTEVFSSIHNTLKSVFPRVVPYAYHIPSYSDMWGWNMACSDAQQHVLTADEFDARVGERLSQPLQFLDGMTFAAAASMNKPTRNSLASEERIYTVDTPFFIQGHGVKSLV